MDLNNKNFNEDHPLASMEKIGLEDKNEDNRTLSSIVPHSSSSSLNNSIPSSTSPTPTIEEISIYNIRTNLRRNLILMGVSIIAFILPFCDTMYLPALDTVKKNLNTSNTLVVISVSIFFFMSGLCCLIWGPLSDRFGRRSSIIIALIIFFLTTFLCIFAPNIIGLITLRAVEGGAASATLVIGQSFVADIYPEEKRGAATGIFFLPFNIGPIIGPLIGGPLSQSFGWRSTFVFLTAFSFLAIIMVFFLVPETHHYFAKAYFNKRNPNKRIIDVTSDEIPQFRKSLKSLFYVIDLTTIPYIILAAIMFATLYTSFTVFPIFLYEEPYNYSETIIGALYVPSGIAMLIGSVFGGWLSDKASIRYGNEKCFEGRLVPGIILSILTPVGLLIYGWTFHYRLNVVGPIIGQILLCFGQATLEPSISAYLTIRKPNEIATVSAMNAFFDFCTTGIVVTCTIPLQNVMGVGPYFSLVCGVNVIIIAIVSVFVYKKIRSSDYVPI